MKFSKISLGVAAACGLMAAPAFALTANLYTNAPYNVSSPPLFGGEFSGTTQNVRISGATAQDPGLLTATLRYCVAGTLHRYSISNNFVYFCTINTGVLTPRPGATQLAVYKYSVGGSGAGTTPVNSATSLPFLDLSKIATSCVPGSSSAVDLDGTGPLSSFVDITCGAASGNITTSVPSYLGISDVEPAFFGTAATYGSLSSESLATVIFGVPVTKIVYEALQTKQGLTPGGLTEADMPSLTQGQLTSLYTQQGQTWGNLVFPGNPTQLLPGDDNVYVVRRVDSSGTQKTFEALVARTINGTAGAKSCQNDVEPFVSDTATPVISDNATTDAACAAVVAASAVITASGGGQVTRCLDGHQGKGRGAIGILSTETKQTPAGNWRFVKINGYAPVHTQVAPGRYTQYTDSSLNLRIGTNLPSATALGYSGTSGFIAKLRSDFSDPVLINIINAGAQTFGQAGLMALDSLQNPVPTADYTGSQSRNPWSRLVGGTTLNNCQPGKAAAF
jgi:hypothetical protein